jgi:hypothetical protein
MLDTINFVDLIALSRITPEATVERFGGLINSSFFDASNILGTLKQKGLVDFVTSFPTQSSITLTVDGKQLLDDAKQKSTLPLDTLDMAVLIELSNGKRNLQDLANGVNVTPKDLAMHLFKLSDQQFVSYELRNGNVAMALTEKGFLQVKTGAPVSSAQVQQPQPVQADQNQYVAPVGTSQPLEQMQPEPPKTEQDLKQLETKIVNAKKMKSIIILVIIIIAVAALGYLYLTHGII